MEEWKDIKDFDNYQISNYGRVMNKSTGRILSPHISKQGYARVNLCILSKSFSKAIHRLVAENFLDSPSIELQESIKHTKNKQVLVNHKDGNKSNNHIDNLEWTNYSKNTKHSFNIGTQIVQRGTDSYNSKLTEEQVLQIRDLYDNANNKRNLTTELSKLYNVSRSNIWSIVNRKSWTHI